MKQTFKAALAATFVLGAASAAHADLTYQGQVGLPLNPTAQIPMRDGVRIQADYFDFGNPGGGNVEDYGIHAAGRLGDNLEINGGVEKFHVPNGSPLDKTGFALGGKYLFSRESDPVGVRIAAGGGYDQAVLKDEYGFVVATKSFSGTGGGRPSVTGDLGARYDHYNEDALGGTSSKASVYGGVEVPLTSAGNFQAVGELQSKNNEYASAKFPYSASLRYRAPQQPWSGSIGIQRQGLTGESGVFVQVGYSFSTSH